MCWKSLVSLLSYGVQFRQKSAHNSSGSKECSVSQGKPLHGSACMRLDELDVD